MKWSIKYLNLLTGLLIFGVAASLAGCSLDSPEEIAKAISAADLFVNKVYQGQGNNLSEAFKLTSEGFQGVASEAVLRGVKNTATGIVGAYKKHSNGRDMTKTLDPHALPAVKIIQFDAVFRNDAAAKILVTMVKENGEWKVQGFDVTSPKINDVKKKSQLAGAR